MFDLKVEAQKVFHANEKWWRDLETGALIERNEGELFSLMASELSEALEGERKSLQDTHLPQYKMAGVEMVDFSIRICDYATRRELFLFDYYEEASRAWLVDGRADKNSNRGEHIWVLHHGLCRAFDANKVEKGYILSSLIADARAYCDVFGYPFEEIWEAKMKFNAERADHKHEARKLADGKKF